MYQPVTNAGMRMIALYPPRGLSRLCSVDVDLFRRAIPLDMTGSRVRPTPGMAAAVGSPGSTSLQPNHLGVSRTGRPQNSGQPWADGLGLTDDGEGPVQAVDGLGDERNRRGRPRARRVVLHAEQDAAGPQAIQPVPDDAYELGLVRQHQSGHDRVDRLRWRVGRHIALHIGDRRTVMMDRAGPERVR